MRSKDELSRANEATEIVKFELFQCFSIAIVKEAHHLTDDTSS